MIELLLFIGLGILILVLFEVRARKEGLTPTLPRREGENSNDSECCGQHLVCERETLLQTNAEIVYYDDEELDALAGIAPADMDEKQRNQIREVFHTLIEKDVPGWCRSIQLRNIQLPEDVREDALMIVRERRSERK